MGAPHSKPPSPAVAPAVEGRLGSLPADWLPVALLAGDAVIAAISVPAGYWIKYGNATQSLPFLPYAAAIPVVVLIYLASLAITNQYRSWRGRTLLDQLFAVYQGIGLAAVLMLAAIELGNLGQSYSRLTILPAVILAAVLMTGERYVLRQVETRMRRRGIGTERVLMVGTGAGSELLIRRMSMFPQYGFHVVGVASDEPSAGGSYFGVPVVGRVEDLPRLARELRADQVFLDLLEVMSSRVNANAIDGLPLVGIRRSQLRGGAAALKRAIDIFVSAVLIVLFSPVMLIVAVLIKVLMPGPLLFSQERIGRHRRPFVIYKFRSMIPDAEAKSGPVVAKPGDDRVTPLGKWLRRLSLDELPQVFNVIKGDMSLVGPRPQPTFFDQQYSGEVPRYLERQQVRPGLTGWAEVNDLRGAAPIVDRTMYDVYYIENWSLALDLKCIILTAMRMFSHHHAY